MASSASRFHAVVLVLDQGKDLHPLVSPDLPAALLPVANDPVLSYSLRLLDSCQVSGVTLVVSGKSRALQVSQWLAQEQDLGLPPPGTAGAGPGSGVGPGSVGPSRRLIREILVVPESFGSADAVRAVLSQGRTARISSESAARGTSVGSGPQNGQGVIITTWSSSSSSGSSAHDSARAQASTDDSSHAKGGGGGDGDSTQAGQSARVGRLSDSLLVLDAAVISNLSLGAVAAAHCRSGATVTTVLIASGQASSDGGTGGCRGGHGVDALSKDKGKGRGSGSASGDLIGLDASGKQQLVFFSGDWKGTGKGNGGSVGAVGVSRTVLESGGGMVLHSSLQDARVYVFDSAKLHTVLEDKPKFSCLRRDVLPHLVQQQWQEHREQQREKLQAMAQGSSGGLLGVARSFSSTKEPSAAVAQLLGYARGQPRGTQCCAYVAPREVFWRRVSSLATFAEANHALVAEEAVPLTGLELSQANNIVHRTVTLGSKSAVGAHCLVGEGTQFGEKCSVKRSLVGRHCRVGANVKITDSVIMDYVTLESGCIVQGCIVSSHATVKELRSIKDCHIGPHAVVTTDEKDANLAKP